MRQLEEEIGVHLFYRHGRGIRLTEEGAQFHASVTPLLHELEQVKPISERPQGFAQATSPSACRHRCARLSAEIDALGALKKLVGDGHRFTVLPHGVILPEIGSEDFAIQKLVKPELSQRFMLAFSLQRPTTLAMRELARRLSCRSQSACGELKKPGIKLCASLTSELLGRRCRGRLRRY